MTTGGYNNTEAQYESRTKYVPSMGGVQINPRVDHSQPRDNKSKTQCIHIL